MSGGGCGWFWEDSSSLRSLQRERCQCAAAV
ncbi:hypothetical protein CRUP_011766 [Coryphaenoides rupestris]|nr:hypothetical protein CRUP_011766 [Coryphaenoides rupestris]